MEIDAIAFRILKFLKDRDPSFIIQENKVLQGIKCHNRIDFDNSISTLFKMKLIDLTKSSISITPSGVIKFKQLKDEQDELAHRNVYRDYDYSILEFLFVNNWGVRINEFPESILAESKQELNAYPEHNLASYLYRNEPYIDFINNEYSLNEQGRKRYSTLTIQKEEEIQKNSRDTYNFIGFEGNFSKDSKSNQSFAKDNANPTTQTIKNSTINETNKKSVLSKVLEHWYWVAGIILAIIGLIVFFQK